MRRTICLTALLACFLFSTDASAGVWLELLHAPCFLGNEDDIDRSEDVFPGSHGEYPAGAIDCFNDDFNGSGSRTILSIKAFEVWKYGTWFLYYDITGPFEKPFQNGITDNEKGGFFGGTTVTLSIKSIAEKFTGSEMNWGALANLHVKYEIEHVSKFGALHYAGLQADFAVPFLDFLTATAVVREDRSLEGVDLQVGAAWQKSFALGPVDFIFGGFFQWGIFGEGQAKNPDLVGVEGNSFFLTQPQLLFDFGKLITFDPGKIYLGFEYQFTVNRYLIEGKSENTLQGMIRWNP